MLRMSKTNLGRLQLNDVRYSNRVSTSSWIRSLMSITVGSCIIAWHRLTPEITAVYTYNICFPRENIQVIIYIRNFLIIFFYLSIYLSACLSFKLNFHILRHCNVPSTLDCYVWWRSSYVLTSFISTVHGATRVNDLLLQSPLRRRFAKCFKRPSTPNGAYYI